MTKRISDRDMLVRTLLLIDDGECCGYFACPGPNKKPIHMASCARATAAYELREYLRRHGGWCPEHAQDVDKCHKPEDGFTLGISLHRYSLCACAPVVRGTPRA